MKTVGIIGAGSFGITLVKILSRNVNVIIYSRNHAVVKTINEEHFHMGTELRLNVKATTDIGVITSGCELLFAVVPSSNFRQMMKDFCPYLKPSHIIIQGTKGLDVSRIAESFLNFPSGPGSEISGAGSPIFILADAASILAC